MNPEVEDVAHLSSPVPDFVSSYLKDLELPTWIGLSDLLLENQYAWSDGVSPVLYTNWNDKEPNNAGGTVRISTTEPQQNMKKISLMHIQNSTWPSCYQQEHCAAISHSPLVSGTWNDDACHKEQSFVCYRKKCVFSSVLHNKHLQQFRETCMLRVRYNALRYNDQ